MPHITVQMYPGRTDEQKAALAKALAETASKSLHREIEHFSVSVVDVPQDEWKEKVYNSAADPNNKEVFVRPGY
ncbi:MAG: tautomerase family protein [Treponemataceae bacterium]|nr:tautomerase family protein [Treponemataceae bacterium]